MIVSFQHIWTTASLYYLNEWKNLELLQVFLVINHHLSPWNICFPLQIHLSPLICFLRMSYIKLPACSLSLFHAAFRVLNPGAYGFPHLTDHICHLRFKSRVLQAYSLDILCLMSTMICSIFFIAPFYFQSPQPDQENLAVRKITLHVLRWA